MMLRISQDAAKWYIKELGLQSGSALRFFPRYSSGGGLHPGFSLGISVEEPDRPVLREEIEGVVFFMEEQDGWYLRGYNLVVRYLESQDDIEYIYEEVQENTTSNAG
ncbi:HesB/YadR/YfhF family protein [Paenibacillus sp. SAF-054]|uniref:HesB/YadR/YfhF family protein n=1 Tax=unclassified Paenibacillus TaxID=185978 RepID=UPI003F7F3579